MLKDFRICTFLIIFFVIPIFNSNLSAQDKIFRAVDVSYGRGFILPHHKYMQYLAKDFTTSAEIHCALQADTNQTWQYVHGFPYVGFGAVFANFNNQEILGKSAGVFFFMKKSLINKKKFRLNYKFAEGISYVSKHFDPEYNRLNTVIGSKFNVYFSTGFEMQHRFFSNYSAIFGVYASHFSNGAIKIPNKGINTLGITLGLKRTARNDKPFYDFPLLIKPDERTFLVILSGGIHQLNDYGKKEYPVATIAAEFHRRKRHTFEYGVGFDLFFDEAIRDKPISDSIYHAKKQDFIYPGIHVSGDRIFGNLSFTMQFGGYFINKPYTYQSVYSRFGFRYKLSKLLLASITLKTYFSAADFIEFGIGIYSTKNKRMK